MIYELLTIVYKSSTHYAGDVKIKIHKKKFILSIKKTVAFLPPF